MLPDLELPRPERLGRIVPPVIVGRMTMEELANRYLDESRHRLGAETIRTYRNALRSAKGLVVDGASVLELDVHGMAQGWAQKVHDAIRVRSGGAMADKFAKLVGAAHRHAANRGVDLPPSPWGTIERYGSPPLEIDFPEGWLVDVLEVIELAHAEGKRLTHPRKRTPAALPRKVADYYTICLCTGARPWCEVLPLRWRDVEASTIRFAFSKGDKKRRKRIRKIPLELLCSRAREALERQRSESEWVWPGRWPDKHSGDTKFAEWWVPFRDFAAAHVQMTDAHGAPLDLYRAGRHGFASHLGDLGFAPHIIAELLGHKDHRSQARYKHLSGRHLLAPARELAASLERGGGKHMVKEPGVVAERLERAIDWLERRAKARAALFGEHGRVQIKRRDSDDLYSAHAIKSWKVGERQPPNDVVHQITLQIGIGVGWVFGEGPDELPEVRVV